MMVAKQATISLSAGIRGIGFWAPGLPDWSSARAFARNGERPTEAALRPSPQLLAPNERRRSPPTVAVALEVAQAACADAARDPRTLPSIFASMHGDLAITDYMCATLADTPQDISPTRFHNSVHNAAAGYWTIGTGCMQATTAISALDATFAQGLIEALTQLATGTEAVLLVAYDGDAPGPLGPIENTEGLLGGALVLTRDAGSGDRLRATLTAGARAAAHGPLARLLPGNAMSPMLPLFDALATGGDLAVLQAGPAQLLRVELAHA